MVRLDIQHDPGAARPDGFRFALRHQRPADSPAAVLRKNRDVAHVPLIGGDPADGALKGEQPADPAKQARSHRQEQGKAGCRVLGCLLMTGVADDGAGRPRAPRGHPRMRVTEEGAPAARKPAEGRPDAAAEHRGQELLRGEKDEVTDVCRVGRSGVPDHEGCHFSPLPSG